MLFKRGPKTPCGAHKKPATGASPKGGYGSGGTPHKAQKVSAVKNKPSGGRKNTPANKPSGGYGTYGKPSPKKPTVTQPMGKYASDGMATPKTGIPTDKRKLYNMPKGKFTGGV